MKEKTSKSKVTKKTAKPELTKQEPTVQHGIYSTRTVNDNGSISLDIDWEKLREHVKNI